jgi:hypothetical protein
MVQMNELTPIPQQPMAVARTTPADLVALAVQSQAPLERLQQLMEMQIQWEKHEAEKAYNVAFAGFKAEAIQLIKTKEITDGPLKGKKHLTLAEIVTVTSPLLAKHGLSLSWKLIEDSKDWMVVQATLRHAAGHCEAIQQGGPPDSGPGRNALQARGSTNTYLQRFTGTAILGLAAREQDDDGAGGADDVPQEAVDKVLKGLLDQLVKCADDKAVVALWTTGKTSLAALDNRPAYDKLKAAVEARRAELKGAAK